MKMDGSLTEPLHASSASTEELRRTVHELNNALTTVLANAQLAAAVLGSESEVAEEIEDVVGGARRAAELARHLKEVVHGSDVVRAWP